jgi:hypothetical protein
MAQLLYLALAGVAVATVYPSLFWTGFIEQADALPPAEAVACVNRTPRVRTSACCCTLAGCLPACLLAGCWLAGCWLAACWLAACWQAWRTAFGRAPRDDPGPCPRVADPPGRAGYSSTSALRTPSWRRCEPAQPKPSPCVLSDRCVSAYIHASPTATAHAEEPHH